ncbi:MAG: lyase family protein, partial [Oscillospiraceae bacterium]
MADFRIEKDSIGEKQVPVEAYYGVQSLRGKENFKITGQKIHSEIIKSLAYIKKACIIANNKAGIVDNKIKDAVCTACDDIIGGMLW